MTIKLDSSFEGFEFEIPEKDLLEEIGPEIAERVRARALASGELVNTGTLVGSYEFKGRRNGKSGTIQPTGTRPDTDTHKKRKKRLTNFGLAKMHAAEGRVAFVVDDSDNEYLRKRVNELIQAKLDAEKGRK